ncbi:thiamine phosphate synthase [Bacillus sp. M6-12]|uniref:thiamine phosphate synthase n=1 Tax=Bacillus sp. M6-12 TaxID=2054166 RepID=UPI0035B55EFF
MGRTSKETLKDALKVYFIMGSVNCTNYPAEVLREAIAGGITMFQYREKGKGALIGDEKYKLAKELQTICREHGIPFLVNDDIELAMSINADGVHIGQEDEPADYVRKQIGDKILGISVHTLEQATDAIQSGADYFGVGPIFPTRTKEDAKPVQGTTVIEEFRAEGFTVPIVGIGGITAENAAAVIEAGADGISVITAISQAKSIPATVQELRRSILF